jgi:hypothetical protein
MKKSATPARITWIKIIIHLKIDLEGYKEIVRKLVANFEVAFKVKHLYYARYTGLESSTVEVSALTGADWNEIKKFFKRPGAFLTGGVVKVEVMDRGVGSLAHAYAYQAVSRIKPFDKDLADDNDFADVMHWMCNMRGMDYVREARLYAYRALVLLHQNALESEKNIQAMRKFNAKARTTLIAEELAERLNLLGMARGRAKPGPHDPPPQPRRSGHAASGKGHGSSHFRSSGSARR